MATKKKLRKAYWKHSKTTPSRQQEKAEVAEFTRRDLMAMRYYPAICSGRMTFDEAYARVDSGVAPVV